MSMAYFQFGVVIKNVCTPECLLMKTIYFFQGFQESLVKTKQTLVRHLPARTMEAVMQIDLPSHAVVVLDLQDLHVLS